MSVIGCTKAGFASKYFFSRYILERYKIEPLLHRSKLNLAVFVIIPQMSVNCPKAGSKKRQVRCPFRGPLDVPALRVGANCAACGDPVCERCSLFYERRLCRVCGELLRQHLVKKADFAEFRIQHCRFRRE